MRIARWVFVAVVLAASASAWGQWYTQPYASRYYKDDWSAMFVRGGGAYAQTIEVAEGVTVAYVQVWSSEPYELLVNDAEVGQDGDAGTVELYEITGLLEPGQNTIELRVPGGFQPDSIVEGQVLYADGEPTPITTDESWRYTRAGNYARTEPSGAFATRRQGPREAHHAVMLEYTPAQRAKASMSRALATIQRVNEQGLLELHAARDPRAILAGEPLAPPELLTMFDLASSAVVGQVDKAFALLLDEKYEEAEKVANTALDFITDVEGEITRVRLLWESQAWERHLDRAEQLLGVVDFEPPIPSSGPPGSQAHQGFQWALAESMARAGNTYLSEPSWSRHNKYGWLLSCVPVGSDAGDWEFSFAPAERGVIDLSGKWRFATDPPNKGLGKGYAKAAFDDSRWKLIRAGSPWEYQGVVEDNSLSPMDAPTNADGAGGNKPYNGYAWYRAEVVVPESWAHQAATLRIARAQTWSWIYVNGKLIGEFTGESGKPSENIALEIPQEALKLGQANTIAIRIYNVENQGGLNDLPILLTRGAPGDCDFLETRVGACLYRHWTNRQGRTAMLASAMSPGAYVLTDANELCLSGWRFRDCSPPSNLAIMLDGEVRTFGTLESGTPYDASRDGKMSAGWILLWHSVRGEDNPRPLLVMVDRPVRTISVSIDETGDSTIRIAVEPARAAEGEKPKAQFARFGVVCPFGDETNLLAELSAEQLEQIGLWSRLMRAYPVEFTELYKPSPDGADVTIAYDYAIFGDAFDTRPLRAAPAPMLHSLGMRHENAGLDKPSAARKLATREKWGDYWAVPDARTIAMKVPPKAAKLLRGASTTFMVFDRGVGWEQVFRHTAEWGANHVRSSIGFTIDWDLPLAKTLAGPLLWEDAQLARLDKMVAAAKATTPASGKNFQIMLNHFWGSFRQFPRADYVKAVGPVPDSYRSRTVRMPDNSSRYWKIKPASRAMIIEIWRRIAERYKDLPPDAVSYDLLNEPAYVHMPDWNRFVADCAAAIRSIDKTHTIVVEAGDGWAQPADFRKLDPPPQANMMYSYHWYGEHNRLDEDLYYPSYRTERGRYDRANLEELLLDTIRFSIVNKVPVHCGETGVSILSPSHSADRWINDFLEFCEKYDQHWSWWEYTGSAYWRTGLVAGGKESPAVKLIQRFMAMNDRNGFHPELYPYDRPEMADLP